MKYFKALLFILIFSYSSLFSLSETNYLLPSDSSSTFYNSAGLCTDPEPPYPLDSIVDLPQIYECSTSSSFSLYTDTSIYTPVSYTLSSIYSNEWCDGQGVTTAVPYGYHTESFSTCVYECADSTQIEFDGSCVTKPTCIDSEYYDSATNTCVLVPECSLGEYWDSNLLECILDPLAPDSDFDNDGTPNKCDKEFALYYPDLYNSYDCDGDSSLNGSDLDDDGDGIPDVEDSDNLLSSDDLCEGVNLSVSPVITGLSTYSLSEYRSLAMQSVTDCVYYGSQTGSWDSSLYYPDLNSNCTPDIWCYVHDTNYEACSETALSYQPVGYTYDSSVTTEAICISKVDNVVYSDSFWYQGDLTICPDSGYCYLKPLGETTTSTIEDTNTEDIDSSMDDNIDLNTTSDDLAPLLSAQNTTNKHLQDLKDKTDLQNEKIDTTNKKIDEVKEVNNKILTNNQDMNSKLTDIKANTASISSNQLITNSRLNTINDSLGTANSKLSTLSTIGLSSNEKLDGIGTGVDGTNSRLDTTNDKLDGIKDAIEGQDLNVSVGVVLDTSETNDLLQEISDKLDENSSDSSIGFLSDEIDNILNKYQIDLTSGGCASIETVSISFHGSTITFLSQATIDLLPMDAMRTIMIFLFTISALSIIFRSN